MIMNKDFYLFIKEYYKQNNASWDNINLIGIRNDANDNMDFFNDWLGFIYDNELNIAKGTTDPGVYYTKNPLNKNGAFHLALGYHKNIWRLKKHKGKYLALCDDWETEKVKGWRDYNKNFENDDNMIVEGNFGINWHYSNTIELIKFASAGCQVTPDIKFFDESIKCAIASEQDFFSYMLFDVKEIPTNLIIEIDEQIRENFNG